MALGFSGMKQWFMTVNIFTNRNYKKIIRTIIQIICGLNFDRGFKVCHAKKNEHDMLDVVYCWPLFTMSTVYYWLLMELCHPALTQQDENSPFSVSVSAKPKSMRRTLRSIKYKL